MTVSTLPAHGLHPSVPFEEYLAWPAASKSSLEWLSRSPAYMVWRRDHPETTDAMRFGAAVHTAVLEPAAFASRYVFAGPCEATKKGDGEPCRNAGKFLRSGAWWCGVHAPRNVEDETTKTVIDAGEYARILDIADAVAANPAAHALLAQTIMHEVSAFWEDPVVGAAKARLDIYAGAMVGDLKVTKDAHPDEIEKFIVNYGVHRQAAHYLDGLAALGKPADAFVVVAIEPTPPHEVAVYALEPDAIRCGRESLRKLKERYLECVRSDNWPGYPTGVLPCSVPEWEYRRQFPEEAMQ